MTDLHRDRVFMQICLTILNSTMGRICQFVKVIYWGWKLKVIWPFFTYWPFFYAVLYLFICFCLFGVPEYICSFLGSFCCHVSNPVFYTLSADYHSHSFFDSRFKGFSVFFVDTAHFSLFSFRIWGMNLFKETSRSLSFDIIENPLFSNYSSGMFFLILSPVAP